MNEIESSLSLAFRYLFMNILWDVYSTYLLIENEKIKSCSVCFCKVWLKDKKKVFLPSVQGFEPSFSGGRRESYAGHWTGQGYFPKGQIDSKCVSDKAKKLNGSVRAKCTSNSSRTRFAVAWKKWKCVVLPGNGWGGDMGL